MSETESFLSREGSGVRRDCGLGGVKVGSGEGLGKVRGQEGLMVGRSEGSRGADGWEG